MIKTSSEMMQSYGRKWSMRMLIWHQIARFMYGFVQDYNNFIAYALKLLHYCHDDVIKWKHFLRNWPCVRGIHQSPVNSPHIG